MKRIIAYFAALFILLVPAASFAATNQQIPAQVYSWGQKTNLTNYSVGYCKDNGGALWQQMADGTWAVPGDELNTCQNGTPQNWQGSSAFDPWQRGGINQMQSPWGFNQASSQYPWGTNYPGGYTNTNDWFTNCVLSQSFVARPECQQYPRNGSFWPVSQPWGYQVSLNTGGEDSITASQVNSGTMSQTSLHAQGGLSSILLGVLVGYGWNQLMK